MSIKIEFTLMPDRVASEPAAEDWGVIPIPHIIIIRFGVISIAAVFNTTGTTATKIFCLAFGTRYFSQCDH